MIPFDYHRNKNFRILSFGKGPYRASKPRRRLQCQFMLCGLICLGVMTTAVSINANQQAENFRITERTLQTLGQENVPQSLLDALRPLLNQLYTSETEFVKILEGIRDPERNAPQAEEIDLILKHAMLNKLWVQSEKTEVDLEKGESLLTGSVQGGIPKDDIIFSADKVRIVTEGSKRYNKIIADNNVQVIQFQRKVTSDRAIYDRATQKLDLLGSVVIEDEGIVLYGSTAYLDHRAGVSEVVGDSNHRVKVEYRLEDAGTSSEVPEPPPSIIQAQRALIDNQKKQAIFEGNVEITRPQLELYLKAGKIILLFNEDRELVASIAEQDVCLQQPGRAARAEKAHVSETDQKIILEGDAEINREGIYLKGPTINLFLDVEQGQAIGDSATLVQMIIPLDEESVDQTSSDQYFNCHR